MDRFVLVTTGDDEPRLTRLEDAFRGQLAGRVRVEALRLGRVNSLRVAYDNAARAVNDPAAVLVFAHEDITPAGRTVLDRAPARVAEILDPWLPGRDSRSPRWLECARELLRRPDTGLLGVA